MQRNAYSSNITLLSDDLAEKGMATDKKGEGIKNENSWSKFIQHLYSHKTLLRAITFGEGDVVCHYAHPDQRTWKAPNLYLYPY